MNPEVQKEEFESHEARIKKVVSNIKAYLKDNLSIVGAAKPGDIRSRREVTEHLKHASPAEIQEALQQMAGSGDIRFVENNEDEFIVE